MRRAAWLPVVVLSAPAFLLTLATPASASVSGGFTAPTQNATYASVQDIAITTSLTRTRNALGQCDRTTTVDLKVQLPGSAAKLIASSTNCNTDANLRYVLDPSCPTAPFSCAPVRNGTVTATLSGGVSATRSFKLQLPPAAPANVSAEQTGQRQITIRWNAGPEPDLTAYEVYDANTGESIAANMSPGTEAFVVDFADFGYGGDHSYLVQAYRSDGSGGSLASQTSNSNVVTLTEPTPTPEPSPSTGNPTPGPGDPTPDPGPADPTPNPSSSGGFGSGSNGSGTGGSGGNTGSTPAPGSTSGFSSGQKPSKAQIANQQRRAFALTFKSFSPKLGAPKLPPLPAFAEPEEEEGTYGTIDYGDQELRELSGETTGGGVRQIALDTITSVFEGERLYSSIAAALLLFLAAAHVRVWLNNGEQY